MKQSETNLGEKREKREVLFYCKNCDYKCSVKFSYDRHLLTAKHQKQAQMKQNETNETKKEKKEKSENYDQNTCECGQSFYSRTTLWRHRKKCNQNLNLNLNSTNIQQIEPQMLIEVLKQNQEFQMFMIEQHKQMIEMAMSANNVINTNCNNTNNNNTFNLQLFLNEKCKDALNINEFVDTIKMQLTDLENFAHLGYAEGVSKICVKNLNILDTFKRPIHCSDAKRETLYIKNNNEWIKENDDRSLLKDAIKKIANKNIRQINEWIKENPNCTDPTSKNNNKYLKIVMNSMSGATIEEQQDNIEKIVKNVTKAVTIDKCAIKY
jgi:hypothetical protein